jgi:flavodoxin/Pyruvate/2-oxoacid:ferredoxin oxidoreductase delta subunit
MNIQLFYYSGAGNTKFIADIIRNKLIQNNHTVKYTKITEESIYSSDNDFDILFLGFPVFFRDAPELVYKLFENLSGENRPIMIFITKGLYSGNAFKFLHKKALENKFIPIGFIDILMPGTDLLTWGIKNNTFSGHIFSNIHSKNIFEKINKFIAKMDKNKEIKKVFNKWYTFLDNLIVKKIEIKTDNAHRNWIGKFVVNNNKCIYCKKCINGCPRKNIRTNNGIEFGIICDICLYCINNCPQEAINIGKNTVDKIKYSEEKIREIFRKEIEKRQTSA